MDAPTRQCRFIRFRDPVQGRPIIARGAPDADSAAGRAALDNERRILERLRGIDGCPHLLASDPTASELVAADPGGVCLADSDLLGQVDLPRFLAIAESLARLVAAIHERRTSIGASFPTAS